MNCTDRGRGRGLKAAFISKPLSEKIEPFGIFPGVHHHYHSQICCQMIPVMIIINNINCMFCQFLSSPHCQTVKPSGVLPIMVMVMEMKMVISIVVESGLSHFAKSFVTLCSTFLYCCSLVLPHKLFLLYKGAVSLKLYPNFS